MLDTIGTTVQQIDIKTQCSKEAFRHLVGRIMQHVFIKVHVSFHRMWAQGMGYHDFVDIVNGPLDPSVKGLQTALGAFIGRRGLSRSWGPCSPGG